MNTIPIERDDDTDCPLCCGSGHVGDAPEDAKRLRLPHLRRLLALQGGKQAADALEYVLLYFRDLGISVGQTDTPRWQPIDTAPKDGRSIMLFPHFVVTHWDDEVNGWLDLEGDIHMRYRIKFTHWVPLPASPSQ